MPNGYGLDGEGIVVGVGDASGTQGHLDFDDRVLEDYNSGNTQDHGTHVGATIVGGGQINPSYRGIAQLLLNQLKYHSHIPYFADDVAKHLCCEYPLRINLLSL